MGKTLYETRKDLTREYTDEILEVIDNQNDMTRSDLQGVIEGLVYRLLKKR